MTRSRGRSSSSRGARARKPDAGRGLPLALRFGLSMSIALALVMSLAGLMLSSSAADVAGSGFETAIHSSARAMSETRVEVATLENRVAKNLRDRIRADIDPSDHENSEVRKGLTEEHQEAALAAVNDVVARVFGEEKERVKTWRQLGSQVTLFAGGKGQQGQITFTKGAFEGRSGSVYRYDGKGDVLVPDTGDVTSRGLLGLILGVVVAVILVGTGVAYVVGDQVSKPIESMVEDVRQIASGNFQHRTRVKGGGEVAQLARSIDRMAESLSEAQDTEVELSMREREIEVAQEVRTAFLPKAPPEPDGYDLQDLHLRCPDPGGDFHVYVATPGGGLGLLVCTVAGSGVPGALVGATARAYLRSELERGGDLEEAFRRINRSLYQDVRRGMYASAMYAQLDPVENIVSVISAGHKIPLVRFDAAESQIRLVHPEGLALAFDKGPVFDQKLEVQRIPMNPGDRIVIANEGPVVLTDPDGQEYGEKAFYRSVLRAAPNPAEELLTRVQIDLEEFAGGDALSADVILMSLARKS